MLNWVGLKVFGEGLAESSHVLSELFTLKWVHPKNIVVVGLIGHLRFNLLKKHLKVFAELEELW